MSGIQTPARPLWPSDDRWLQALPHPVVAVDPQGIVVGCNIAAAALLQTGGSLVGMRFADAVLDVADQGGFDEVLRLATTGATWGGELRLTGTERSAPAEFHVAPIEDANGLRGAMVVVDRTIGAGARTMRLSERLGRLARAAAELLSAEDVASVTEIVVAHLADAAGATTASLSLVTDDDTLALAGIRGGTEGAAQRWATYPVDASTPAGEVVRSGQTQVIVGRAELEKRFPTLEMAALGERSMVCLPLLAAHRVIGVAQMSFPGRRDFDAAELEFYRVMADTCAQALERIRASADVAVQSGKLQLLAEASVELGSSLDYESTLRNVAWLAVPGFADWCAIQLEQDGLLRTLAVAHMDPVKLALAEEYQQRFPPDPEASTGNYEVLRTGRSHLVTELTDEMMVESVSDPEQLEMLRGLSFRSGLVVALKARGRVFGTVTWVSGESRRRFDESDVGFGEDLARRASVAIDNALLHSELKEVADRLQRAVLPPELPRLAGWTLGALYLSAGRTDVGGDFYDAIPLDGNGLALFIGDVMGRGVQAAATMAQISAALRTLVAVDPTPRAVLSRLDLLFGRFPSDQLVTVAYAVADPQQDRLTIASAGHPPPLLVDADGHGEFVDGASGLILGAGGTKRTQTTLPFLPGQTLVLFTDGLIERRTEDLDVGRERLRRAAAQADFDDPNVALKTLADTLRDPTRDDDLAVLCARRLPG